MDSRLIFLPSVVRSNRGAFLRTGALQKKRGLSPERSGDRGRFVALVWKRGTEKSRGGNQRTRTKTDTGR